MSIMISGLISFTIFLSSMVAAIPLNRPFPHNLYLNNFDDLKILPDKNIYLKGKVLYIRVSRIIVKLKSEKNN